MQRLILSFVASFLVIGCAGDCSTTNRLTGDEGRLVFEYDWSDDPRNFNKPLMVGGRMDLRPTGVGDAVVDSVEEGSSDNRAVLAVDDTSADAVTVVGRAAGDATLRITAQANDGTRMDRVRLRVREVADVRFWPAQARETFSLQLPLKSFPAPEPTRRHEVEYEVDSKVHIPWRRRTAGGETLVGRGAVPVRVKPAGAAEILHEETGESLVLRMPPVTTEFEIVGLEGVGGDTISVEVVDKHWWKRAERALAVSQLAPSEHGAQGWTFWLGLWLGFVVVASLWVWQQFSDAVRDVRHMREPDDDDSANDENER